MARENIILACNDCKERNYFTTKNRRKHPERVEWKKFCSSTSCAWVWWRMKTMSIFS